MTHEGFEHSSTCDVCGEEIVGTPWLGLNRYEVGTGEHRCMSQAYAEDYFWDMDDDVMEATMFIFHWPVCASMFTEAKMIETDVEIQGRPQ